jgi:iron complex transport system substrate-binding protein
LKRILVFVFVILLIGPKIECKEIVDMSGRTVRVPEKIERIVGIGPGALRMITYLSAVDKVVGVERVEKGGFTPYGRPYTLAIREKIKNLPIIGEGGPGKLPDFESLVNVKPHAIFALGFDRATMDMIQEKTKTPVVGLEYGSLGVLRAKKFIESLTLLASLLGKEKRAKEIEEFLYRTEAYLNRKTLNEKERPRVYAGGIGFKGQHGITSTEAGFLPFKLVKARNVVDELGKDGHLFIEKERLLSLNPDIIFLDVNGLSVFEKELAEAPDFFMNLKAMKENKVFTILPYNYYNTNVEIALSDAYFIGKVAYPHAFRDMDIDLEVDKIIRFFVKEAVFSDIKKNFGKFGRVTFKNEKLNIIPLR